MLPAPTAPSEGYAGVRNLVHLDPKAQPDPLSILAHQLRRRFPSDRSLLRGARPIYSTAPPESSPVFRPVRPFHESPSSEELKPSGQSRPIFRGPSWGDRSRVPLRSPKSREGPQEPRRTRGNFLFRRLFPAGPGKNPKALPIACRRRSVLLPLPRPSCRCRLSGETGTSAPITGVTMLFRPESGKRKIRDQACGKRGYREQP